MKKVVIVNGIISGLIVSALMVCSTLYFINKGDFDNGMVYGYASMLLAFSFVLVGIKTYRDKYNDGLISFGKAFTIGLLITLIAATFYVVTWQIEGHFVFPDFADRYSAAMLEKAKTSGASAAEIAKQAAEMKEFAEMYKNPLVNILFTYLEIVPVGLVVSLVCALLLKRNKATV